MDRFATVNASGDIGLNLERVRPAPIQSHPVEVIQRSHMEIAQTLERTTQRNVFGAFFPMYIQMQEAYLEQIGRAPHLPSSNIGLEVFRGDDETIDFCDFMGDSEDLKHIDVHVAMERKLGIQLSNE